MFVGIALLRYGSVVAYRHYYTLLPYVSLWRIIYIIGAALGGAGWGLITLFMFPHANATQQTLMIVMLAGVTSGAIPLSSAIPQAAIAFLLLAIIPLIIIIPITKNIYYLFDAAVMLYVFYSIYLAIGIYQVIKNSFKLKFENDALLEEVTDAKIKLEASNKMLERVATHDPLTSVSNRILFEKNVAIAIRHAELQDNKFAIFYLDLDSFKPINDRYGHHIGDKVLMIVVSRLKNLFGSEEVIARLGGDEFAILVEGSVELEKIGHLIQSITKLLTMPIKILDLELTVGVSIGVSIYPNDGKDVEVLLYVADKAMYVMKSKHKKHITATESEETSL
jgi:diguanylate cyclase (GGDEF)-like protein